VASLPVDIARVTMGRFLRSEEVREENVELDSERWSVGVELSLPSLPLLEVSLWLLILRVRQTLVLARCACSGTRVVMGDEEMIGEIGERAGGVQIHMPRAGDVGVVTPSEGLVLPVTLAYLALSFDTTADVSPDIPPLGETGVLTNSWPSSSGARSVSTLPVTRSGGGFLASSFGVMGTPGVFGMIASAPVLPPDFESLP
jgi:hypothetical protein